MKKLLFIIVISSLSFISSSQVVYDFSVNPFSSGWSYYDDFGSNPTPGFMYDSGSESVNYSLGTTVEISFIHRDLPMILSKDYCVSFKITPSNSNNYNTFFPLILTPNELTGSHLHPWRLNAPNMSVAGGFQNVDFLAVEVFSNEIRLINRDNNIIVSSSIQSMVPAFYMQPGTSYWVKLEISNSVNAILSVFSDGNFTNLLNTTSFLLPVLDDMSHIYIANSNGNNSCTQEGSLDEYRINSCITSGVEEISFANENKKLVKIVDLMGRETVYKSNAPLIFIYNDGSTKKILNVEL